MAANVLFICFNRPHLTRVSFERLREAKPGFLHIASDGPRISRPGEAALCDEVRSIFDDIDWPCHVVRDFAPENMGCERRIESALQNTFENVDRAIVLEDDLLPQQGFYGFCETLLDRYADEPQVGTIAGSSYVRSSGLRRSSYYFSRYANTLGWGTYKRVIDRVDWRPDPDEIAEKLRDVLERKSEGRRWAENVELVYNGTVSTWDFQFVISQLLARQLAATPRVSLVTNIGSGPDATHTPVNDDFFNRPVGTVPDPIRHPRRIHRSVVLDGLHSVGAVRPRNDLYLKVRPYAQEARTRLAERRLRSLSSTATKGAS
jgi:hypothetical protein